MKTIFVTGAASGIGRATALLFGQRGFRVGCYDIDVEGARKTAESIGGLHGRIDVANDESWAAAVADFAGAAERLDVLFNCAGILRIGPFEEIDPEFYRRQLDVNVMGVILGIRRCLPLLERSGNGVIVNMSSASAIYGQPELAVYSATKFAIRALTEALDIEFRARGVRVCDVMPLFVDTPMVRTQSASSGSLEHFGVKLTSDDVAEVVWKAVHGSDVHYLPQREMALMNRIAGLVPAATRAVIARIAAKKRSPRSSSASDRR